MMNRSKKAERDRELRNAFGRAVSNARRIFSDTSTFPHQNEVDLIHLLSCELDKEGLNVVRKRQWNRD